MKPEEIKALAIRLFNEIKQDLRTSFEQKVKKELPEMQMKVSADLDYVKALLTHSRIPVKFEVESFPDFYFSTNNLDNKSDTIHEYQVREILGEDQFRNYPSVDQIEAEIILELRDDKEITIEQLTTTIKNKYINE